jgi:hypothetical protein
MPSTYRRNTPEDYRWLDEWVQRRLDGVIGLTLARVGSPERFLKLVGAEPFQPVRGVPALSAESPPGYELVGATAVPDNEDGGVPGWILGAECSGNTGSQKAAVLSAPDSEVLAFYYNGGIDWLSWAESGHLLAEVSLYNGDVIDGDDPQGFADKMRRAGLDPDSSTDYPCATAAILMMAMTGVVITAELLDETVFVCGAVRNQ